MVGKKVNSKIISTILMLLMVTPLTACDSQVPQVDSEDILSNIKAEESQETMGSTIDEPTGELPSDFEPIGIELDDRVTLYYVDFIFTNPSNEMEGGYYVAATKPTTVLYSGFFDEEWRPTGIGLTFKSMEINTPNEFMSATYAGNFVDGARSGQGIAYRPSPTGEIEGAVLYEGEWANSMMNGEGTIYLEDGVTPIYSGQWVYGVRNGAGIEYYESGRIFYKGYFYEDEYNGFGEFFYDNARNSIAIRGEFDGMQTDGYYRTWDVYTNPLEEDNDSYGKPIEELIPLK